MERLLQCDRIGYMNAIHIVPSHNVLLLARTQSVLFNLYILIPMSMFCSVTSVVLLYIFWGSLYFCHWAGTIVICGRQWYKVMMIMPNCAFGVIIHDHLSMYIEWLRLAVKNVTAE